MTIHPDALKLIQEFEGYARRLNDGTDRVKPYADAVGVPTIGYGSTYYKDGRRVALSDPPMTKAEASDLMSDQITRKYEAAVVRLTTAPISALSMGALTSFAYNLGEGAYRGSNLRKAVNEKRWHDVPAEFAKWRTARGVVLAGLVRRRKAESDLFVRGLAQPANANPESNLGPTAHIPAPAPAAPELASRPLWRRALQYVFGR